MKPRTCENCYYFDDSEAFAKICTGKRFDTIEETQEHNAKMGTAEYRARDKFCFIQKISICSDVIVTEIDAVITIGGVVL